MLGLINAEKVKERLDRGIDLQNVDVISSKSVLMETMSIKQIFLYIEESSKALLPYVKERETRTSIATSRKAIKRFDKAMSKGYKLTEEDMKNIGLFFCLNSWFLEGDGNDNKPILH